MKIAVWIVSILVGLVVIAWIGLQVQPKSFPAYSEVTKQFETVPLPDGFPAPVERFYRAYYGDEIPVVESAVLTGRSRRCVTLWRLPVERLPKLQA